LSFILDSGILSLSESSTKHSRPLPTMLDWLKSTIIKFSSFKTLPHLRDLGLPLLIPKHLLLIHRRLLPREISLRLAPPLGLLYLIPTLSRLNPLRNRILHQQVLHFNLAALGC
jgi:hypothetical protein